MIRRNLNRTPLEPLAVEQMELACLVLSDSDDRIDRQQGREAPDCRCQRAKNTELRTIVAIVGIEGVADEAAIARARAEQSDLALELDGGSRDQRKVQRDAGIADGQPRREIVASVDDQMMTAE